MLLSSAPPIGLAGSVTPALAAAPPPAAPTAKTVPNSSLLTPATPATSPLDTGTRVQVWDMSSGIEQPVTGASLTQSTDPYIQAAYQQALRVDAFFRDTFGRNGWDGKGTPLRIVVHAPNEDGTPRMCNSYWDPTTRRIYVGDGDGDLYAPLGNAFDVMVHEATHAIVENEVGLSTNYDLQGGLNESWADVMAVVADDRNWLIGEDVFTPNKRGDGIRDLAHPRFGSVQQLPTGVPLESYDYSEIPSLAAVRVAEKLGRKEMGKIWYDALVDHLDKRAGFAAAARATLDAAAQLHGRSSNEVQAVLDAWKSVGVDPRWKRSG